MYFSIVIPTYNRADMLERVLKALSAQERAPEFEVVLVNDGSSDDTVSRVTDLIDSGSLGYQLRFETQPNSGPGRARNRGVELAAGTFTIFIGDDTVPEPAFVAQHAEVHLSSDDDPMLACLGYTGWPREDRVTSFMDYINDYGLQFGYALIEHGSIVPFNFFYTSNISIATETLRHYPFDTTFPAAAWEDIELAYRLESKGLKIRYNAHAVTRHYHPMTVASFARRQYTVGKSGAIFARKHPELGHFLGVHEIESRPRPLEGRMRRLTWLAELGEKFRPIARASVFEELMREHYLRGLRDGLQDIESRVE